MSIEAEQAVLASCINSAEGYDAVSEHLKADDFTDDRMRLLFELVSKMREAGRTPDTVTITAVLGKSERWARTGLDDPLEYVNAIESLSYSFIAVSEYIEIIKSASIARRMLQYCSELAEVAYDGNLNADEKLAEMQSRLPSFESGGQAFLQYGDAAKLAAKQIIARAQGEISGHPA